MHCHSHIQERCAAPLRWAVRSELQGSAVGKSWQAESSHSRCSLTLPSPRANAQMQMSAQATGRGDKTHQVTLPFRTVNTLPCHRCVIPSHQMIIVIECDRQHLCRAQKNGWTNWETEAADLQTLMLWPWQLQRFKTILRS